MELERKRRQRKLLIYGVFVLYIFLRHLPIECTDDDVLVLASTTNQSLLEYFLDRYALNGRIFTDVLAYIILRFPLILWKIADTGIYLLLAMLISRVFTKNTDMDVLAVCGLIVLYPFYYLSSAGYVSTTTNYAYPVLCLMVVAWQVKAIGDGKRPSVITYALTLLSVAYAVNHDQSAMVLLGGLVLYLLYNVLTKGDKRLIWHLAVLFVISLVGYGIMFVMPGHIRRMTSDAEMLYWLPQYADWSLAVKLYHGYSTTVAQLFYSKEWLFLVLCGLCAILALGQEKWIVKMIGCFPICLIFFAAYVGRDKFTFYYTFAYGMPDLVAWNENLLPLILATIGVVCLFYTVFVCVKNQDRRYKLLIVLLLGAGSREMMGLSATVYASSFRTFTFFLYACILSCLTLMEEFKEQGRLRALGLSRGLVMTTCVFMMIETVFW